MSKKASPRALAPNEAVAKIPALRVSPRKLNLLAGLIRGRPVEVALQQLAASRKRSAKDVRTLLLSAVANAETNHGLDVDSLYVGETYVGKAMVMKRFMARARGRGTRIEKPFSNMTIIVREYVRA